MLRTVGAVVPKFGAVQLICAHWRSFPPEGAVKELDAPMAQLRFKNEISDVEYQRYLVWKRICGLLRMNKKKCRRCDHVRVLTKAGGPSSDYVIMKKDGTGVTPFIDLPTKEILSRRNPSHLTAKFVKPPHPPLKTIRGKGKKDA